MKINPLLLTDFYKVGHPFQYPIGTNLVYSNLTPRKSRINGVDKMVFFGLQYFIKEYLITYFNENFFKREINDVMTEYKRRVRNSLGGDLPTYSHIEDLHKLGYLPIEIKSLPEGYKVDMKIPVITIVNTLPEFYWLTNFIESLMSSILWQPCTSATIAGEYRKILDAYAKETGMPEDFVQWQGHDFSFRGMSSLESAVLSGMGHLLYFTGTDTIPAIDALEKYYKANSDNELIGGSVPATEHSVMCSGEKGGELKTFERLITQVYPSGIVSIVSDTWDLWKVCTEYLQELKQIVMSRDGKVVIRPDSGDPVDIICGVGFEENGKYFKYVEIPQIPGEKKVEISINEYKGVVELLWDVFGGTEVNGYKLLDPHIGVIYGDSITLERAKQICERLKNKGFASQVVFGIGSFTYQYNTRDTFGIAMKATFIEVNGVGRNIFKNPVTDDGTKKSATGLLSVLENENGFYLTDNVSWEQEQQSLLKPIFKDGILLKEYSLSEIRATANNQKTT